jgi:tetratricopeptide (TPR) repeat protein
MGVAFLRWKSYSEALTCFEKAFRIKSSAPLASQIASLLFMEDRATEAEKFFEESIQNFPDSKELFFNFAGMRVDQGRFEEAQQLFKKALAIDPEDTHSARGLAYCEEALKSSQR